MLPLHQAIEDQEADAVIALIREGVDVNEADPTVGGARPLHIAVDIECEEACRLNDEGDESAIPAAVFTRLLLVAGADPYLTDGNGNTAIDWARNRNHA
jgi:ankyrin repeat protein